MKLADFTFKTGSGGSGGGAVSVTNFTPATAPHFFRTMAAAKAGTGKGRWGAIGGSATRGEGATGEGRAGGAYRWGWFTRLYDVLEGAGIPANLGILTPVGGWRDQGGGYPAGKAFANFPEHDPRVAFTGAVTGGNSNVLGGRGFRFNAAAGSLAFTPPSAYDRVSVWHHNNGFASNGAITAGAATGVVNNNAAGTAVYSRVDLTLASPVTTPVTISWVSGDVFFNTILTELSTRPAISLLPLGVCGSATHAAIENNNSQSPMAPATRDAYALDVVFMSYTGNDISQATPLATYRANLEALITFWQRGGLTDVVMVSGPPYGTGIEAEAAQRPYIEAFRDIAKQRNLPLVDFWERTGTRAARSRDTGWYADEIHAGPIGQIRWSEMFQPLIPD